LVGLLIGFGSILTKSTRYQLIADYYAWTDNYSTAIYYYNQGLEVADTDQDLARLYSHRGMAYHHQDQAILAVNDLTQAIELSPRGRYYLYRGIVYYQHEDYDVATIDLSESLTLELDEDERIRALFFRASAYVELKAYDLAIEDYETLLTLRLSTRERTRAQTSLNYIQQLGFE
jgi:tetratricopeptide (TPR) repeat protein